MNLTNTCMIAAHVHSAWQSTTLTKTCQDFDKNLYNYFDKYIHLTINHWPISSTLLPPSLHHIDYFFGSVYQQHHLTVGQGSQGGLGLGEERAPAVLVAQVVQARVEVLLVVVVPGGRGVSAVLYLVPIFWSDTSKRSSYPNSPSERYQNFTMTSGSSHHSNISIPLIVQIIELSNHLSVAAKKKGGRRTGKKDKWANPFEIIYIFRKQFLSFNLSDTMLMCCCR